MTGRAIGAAGTGARATVNFYLVPGVTAVMAWLVLGEDLSLFAVAGLIVASIGCRLVGARPRPPAVAAGELQAAPR